MSEAGDLIQDDLVLLIYVMKYCENGFEKRPLNEIEERVFFHCKVLVVWAKGSSPEKPLGFSSS